MAILSRRCIINMMRLMSQRTHFVGCCYHLYDVLRSFIINKTVILIDFSLYCYAAGKQRGFAVLELLSGEYILCLKRI